MNTWIYLLTFFISASHAGQTEEIAVQRLRELVEKKDSSQEHFENLDWFRDRAHTVFQKMDEKDPTHKRLGSLLQQAEEKLETHRKKILDEAPAHFKCASYGLLYDSTRSMDDILTSKVTIGFETKLLFISERGMFTAPVPKESETPSHTQIQVDDNTLDLTFIHGPDGELGYYLGVQDPKSKKINLPLTPAVSSKHDDFHRRINALTVKNILIHIKSLESALKKFKDIPRTPSDENTLKRHEDTLRSLARCALYDKTQKEIREYFKNKKPSLKVPDPTAIN
ncbi:MAG: hypothetical protein AB7O96_12820 [Pseudobdellovibrionaceae bacterium]